MEADLGAYLASIDWVKAIVVGGLVIAVGAVVLRFVIASTAEVGAMLPGASDAAARAVLDSRTDMPIDSWVCRECRSVNTPTATVCYIGCGPREEVGTD
ncbi:MAG TPA: hypothetical protein VF119_03660, partial [Candidatus Limnocylindrales bacterium]